MGEECGCGCVGEGGGKSLVVGVWVRDGEECGCGCEGEGMSVVLGDKVL